MPNLAQKAQTKVKSVLEEVSGLSREMKAIMAGLIAGSAMFMSAGFLMGFNVLPAIPFSGAPYIFSVILTAALISLAGFVLTPMLILVILGKSDENDSKNDAANSSNSESTLKSVERSSVNFVNPKFEKKQNVSLNIADNKLMHSNQTSSSSFVSDASSNGHTSLRVSVRPGEEQPDLNAQSNQAAVVQQPKSTVRQDYLNNSYKRVQVFEQKAVDSLTGINSVGRNATKSNSQKLKEVIKIAEKLDRVSTELTVYKSQVMAELTADEKRWIIPSTGITLERAFDRTGNKIKAFNQAYGKLKTKLSNQQLNSSSFVARSYPVATTTFSRSYNSDKKNNTIFGVNDDDNSDSSLNGDGTLSPKTGRAGIF